jgi:histidinol-phosphate aminotransferase
VAVKDQSFVRSFKRELIVVRRRFIDRLRGIARISPIESEANFVLLRTNSENEAQNLDDFLRQRGIVLRRQTAVGLANCLRATIGTAKQMEFVASMILEWCSIQADR